MLGVELLKRLLPDISDQPGIYRMIDAEGRILYIGKAKNLRNRLSQYADINRHTTRIQRMICSIADVSFMIVRSESEALMLEARLIKEHKPPYNILLRDDKSFPYIAIDNSHDYPRIFKHRGARVKDVEYFGPYPSAQSVNSAISTLQRAFLIRPCADSFFKNRSKPCMEYQIKRCSAPCVEYISQADYAVQIAHAKDFLKGRTQDIKHSLQNKMQLASDEMKYELAADYRNRISALTAIQNRKDMYIKGVIDADIIALTTQHGRACVQVFFVRGGAILGNAEYFPSNTDDMSEADILEFFITSFYENKPLGRDLIISHDIQGRELLEKALSELSGRPVGIMFPLKGEKRRLVEMVLDNARNSLERKLSEEASAEDMLKRMSEVFDIARDIRRIEVFDNSHIFGESAVGAMIVAGYDEENKWGLLKKLYRRFNVEPGEKVTGGDDFEMMRQVMRRRYGRIKSEATSFPDVVLIDGGQGQLSVAMEVFKELGVEKEFYVIAIAKGEDRNAGREDFYMPGKTPFKLEKNDPLLYFLQNMRDEVHRFAITGHRSKRSRNLIRSRLDEIPDIGSVRKKALLHHFGSVAMIEGATVSDLMKVKGISRATAEKIHGFFH